MGVVLIAHGSVSAQSLEDGDSLAPVPPPPEASQPSDEAPGEQDGAEPDALEPDLLEPGPGCTVVARLEHDGLGYIGCAEGFIYTHEGQRFVGRIDIQREIADLFVRRDQVWVETTLRDATSLRDALARTRMRPPPRMPPRTPLTTPPRAHHERPVPPTPPRGERYSDWMSPDREPGFEFGLGIHPLVASGFALLMDAFVEYHAPRAFSVKLTIDPVGLSVAGSDSIGVFHGWLTAALDFNLFRFGVGVGVAQGRVEDFSRGVANGLGPTLVFPIRIGSREGMHLEILNFVIFPDADARYGGTRAALQIPLKKGRWLLFRGGGSGPVGYAFGELALRVRVRGEGGPGSIYLVPGIGGGAVFSDIDFDDGERAGFSTSLSFEFRP